MPQTAHPTGTFSRGGGAWTLRPRVGPTRAPSLHLPDLRPRGIGSVGDVLGNTPGIGHDRQRWVDAGSCREGATIHYKEIVNLMTTAPAVQDGAFRVVAHARRAVLV